ncbi:MAG: short-chain dehydrogenase [Firmicutes bacterium HGW-Firmicutes-1]|jgi:benzil reductase ((S)-benzoin forming)|nr:MAG: short-chain dehydrogenase [Firmicutes bacterium HGW-Firmicutes-1]
MNYYIISGTSRGLGEAIARKLLKEDNYLICISRTTNNNLVKTSKEKGYKLCYIEFDLSRVDKLDEIMTRIFENIKLDDAEKICLINNAGTVAPIKTIDDSSTSEIISSFNVNTLAPIVLTSNFIAMLKEFRCEKRIVNISSGAGKKPYDGWSCYCSTKAALDMFTRCVAIEQEKEEFPVKIISFAPGIIDTDMQNEIRQASIKHFSQLERFIGLKENGSLMSVDFVADKAIDLLDNIKFIQGGVIDIRDK